jgi:hypothetical protein
MLAGLILCAALGLALTFELGRRQAGFDGVQAARDRAALQDVIDAHVRTEHELKVQLVAAGESRLQELRERSEVAKTIGEQQAQIGKLQQDLDFYRGMVQQQLPQTASITYEQFRIVPGKSKNQFVLRFTVKTVKNPEQSFVGIMAATVDGDQAGSAASIDLSTIARPKVASFPVAFHYFKTIEQTIELPADFNPQRVTIEVRPQTKGVAPYRQTFLWSITAG